MGFIATTTHNKLSSYPRSKEDTQQSDTQLSDLLSSANAESASLMNSMLQMSGLSGNGVLVLVLKVSSLNYVLYDFYTGKNWV